MLTLRNPARAVIPANIRPLASGILWGLGAAAIWSGWWVATRFSVTGGLSGPDLAALRFGVAGVLLLPVLWRNRSRLAGAPRFLLLIMAAGSGAPYALVAGLGLKFASAGNGGALTLGMLPVFTALLSAWILRERLSRGCAAGIAAIAIGALTILGPGLGAAGAWPGHLMFLLGAAMWAGFTVAMRLSGLGAMTATAIVCVFSAAGYLPAYLIIFGVNGLLVAPAQEIVFQTVYQGGLSAIGAMFCYGRAIEILGATRAAVFAAIVPVLATLLGFALLAEVPSTAETAGVAMLSLGIHVASRGAAPLPAKIPRRKAAISTLSQPLDSTQSSHIGPIAAKSGT